MISLTCIISKSWALPNCPSSPPYDNCYGSYTLSSGDKYIGEWKNNKRNGQGTYLYGPNSKNAGDKYVGEWKDGIYHGRGTYYFLANNTFKGDVFSGNFKANSKLFFKRISACIIDLPISPSS